MTWKVIKGTNRYSVSTTGDVRNDLTGLVLKKVLHHTGYLSVSLRINGIIKLAPIHRLVAETFINKQEGLNVVNHIDAVKINNNVTNLEWCDREHNELHAKLNGLKAKSKGESNGTSVLTSNQVQEIRDKYSSGVRQFELATLYNISRASICNIVNKKSWV